MFFFERFVDRLSKSEYKFNFVIKGGLLISSMIGIDNRTTMDMDTTIKGMPLQVSIPACFIPSFRREDTANPVDKIPQFREWSTIIPELDTADFLNLYTVFMRLTA